MLFSRLRSGADTRRKNCFAAQEERFSRLKNDARFPSKAIESCLSTSHIDPKKIDYVVYYEKPLLTFERLIETYAAFAPRGLESFLHAMPIWLKHKLNIKKNLRQELARCGIHAPLRFSNHHLSHAASAFYPSPYRSACVITCDAVGEWATASIGHGIDHKIKTLREMNFPHSWGLFYSAVTAFLGFRVNSDEYKVMGLAPYGDPIAPQTKRFEQLIRDNIVTTYADGSIWLNKKYFAFATHIKMVFVDKWEQLLEIKLRRPNEPLTKAHANLALAVQNILNQGIILMAKEGQRLTGERNLVMAGGVALNCTANGFLLKEKIFDNIWIQPAAGDAGGALGAALAFWHLGLEQQRVPLDKSNFDHMNAAYLGPEYSNQDITTALTQFPTLTFEFLENQILSQKVAHLLMQEKIIAWFEGRMEWGPRALGHRSILAATHPLDMQKKINLKTKFREGFRPFAPIVREEDLQKYFEQDSASPYMLFTAPLKSQWRHETPDHYQEMVIDDMLNFNRSQFQAITHVDFSARLQTVHKKDHPRLHQLLGDFASLSGHGILVNTSFNVRDEPIVCTPMDALRCFSQTQIDYLVIGSFLVSRNHGTQ